MVATDATADDAMFAVEGLVQGVAATESGAELDPDPYARSKFCPAFLLYFTRLF